jgi:hypothetical protein
MTCPRCRQDNPGDAVFCQECGARLDAVCPSCATPNPLSAKFCKKCGQRLSGPATEPAIPGPRFGVPESYTPKHLAERILISKSALEGERKQVTVLFADLKGSMELLADRDPEEARQLLAAMYPDRHRGEHREPGADRSTGSCRTTRSSGVSAIEKSAGSRSMSNWVGLVSYPPIRKPRQHGRT